MQVTLGPKVARRVLRYELDRLCTQAGRTHAEAGARLGMSRVGFNHVIMGRNLPSKPALEILMDYFGRPDKLPMLLELLALAKLKPDQMAIVPQALEPSSSTYDFELFVGLEAFATGIDVFESMVVNGLLQTEAYARALITFHAEITPGVDVDQSVSMRMRRQAVLTRDDNPTALWCAIEEHVLRRPVGGTTVMASQLDHLLTMTQRPNITVQVLPQTAGVHPVMTGSFSLLRFGDDWRVGYEETRRSAYYYDAPEAVEDYERAMNHLRHMALNPKRSRALIAQVRKELQT